jgi:glycosyl transferase family 61
MRWSDGLLSPDQMSFVGSIPALKEVSQRAYRKLRFKWRSFTGLKARDVLLLGGSNAADIASRYSGVVVETLDERAPDSTLDSRCLPGDELVGIEPFRIELESTLFDITNKGFSFRNNVVFDPELRILFPAMTTREAVLMFNGWAPRRVRHLEGTVAYLSNTWVDNYYHWLQLTLPLLRVYRKMRPATPIDFYYVGESRSLRLQLETLERLGIGRHQVITEPCTGDRLLAVFWRRPIQHFGFNYRDVFGHNFVRSLFVPPQNDSSPSSPKRLYIERGEAPSRRILNETEVIALLRSYGFTAARMDGRSVAEQAKLFWNAETVVGVHGAALTNLLFAKPGTKLIEIFPYEAHEPGMFTVATHGRLQYYHLRGEALDPKRESRQLALQHTRVDLAKLGLILQLAGIAKVE